MKDILAKILIKYNIESHQAYTNQIHSLSKNTIIELFNDLLTKYINILISGFVDGKLIYLLEFPFTTKFFINKLKIQKQFPQGKKTGKYLHSANFAYTEFRFAPDKSIQQMLSL